MYLLIIYFTFAQWYDRYLVYDNINIANRKYDQRLDNHDTFENGATATIVVGEPLGDIRQHHHTQQPLLMLQDFLPERSDEHFYNVAQFHLTDVLKRRKRDSFKYISINSPQLQPLAIEETRTYPLPSMHIDQASVEGNLQIIEKIVQVALGLPEEYFEGRNVIIAGDQLTVSRIESLKRLRRQDVSRYERMEWVFPVLQLFHLQMTLCATILRNHYGSENIPGSLAWVAKLLKRKRVNPDNFDYHSADDFLRITFDAMVLRIWEHRIMEEKGEEGWTLESWGDEIRAETTHNCDIHTTLSVFTDFECPCITKTMDDHLKCTAKPIIDEYLRNVNDPTKNLNDLDINAALFIRDMIYYKELSGAIKSGDVGRLEEVLRMITVMLQAGKTKNYGNGLLHIINGLRNKWNNQLKTAIVRSWLINTEGREGHWIPADLYQEHNNLLTKTIHRAKGSNFTWEFLAESISTNVRHFSTIKSKIEREFDLSHNSSYHSTVADVQDFQKLLRHLEGCKILGFDMRPNPVNRPEIGYHSIPRVDDLFDMGLSKLISGRLQKFNQNSADIGEEYADEDVEMESVM